LAFRRHVGVLGTFRLRGGGGSELLGHGRRCNGSPIPSSVVALFPYSTIRGWGADPPRYVPSIASSEIPPLQPHTSQLVRITRAKALISRGGTDERIRRLTPLKSLFMLMLFTLVGIVK